MVELLSGFPGCVVAYKATGHVTHDEYEAIVMKRVDEVARKFNKINFLVLLETRMENYSFRSFIDYLKISFKHFTQWNRMAIVTDEAWIREAYEDLNMAVEGVIKSYKLKNFPSAKAWVSVPLAADTSGRGKQSFMQRIKKAFTASLVGTSLMTAFSYAMSAARKENFKEPVLLGRLLNRILPVRKVNAYIMGWTAHYVFGYAWAILFSGFLKEKHINNIITKSICLGSISGLVAVFAWRNTFRHHPAPPRLRFGEYYAQLVAAHVVFAAACLFTLNQLAKENHTASI